MSFFLTLLLAFQSLDYFSALITLLWTYITLSDQSPKQPHFFWQKQMRIEWTVYLLFNNATFLLFKSIIPTYDKAKTKPIRLLSTCLLVQDHINQAVDPILAIREYNKPLWQYAEVWMKDYFGWSTRKSYNKSF